MSSTPLACMINHTKILLTIAVAQSAYFTFICENHRGFMANPIVYLREIFVKNAKCVKYCADKYYFLSLSLSSTLNT